MKHKKRGVVNCIIPNSRSQATIFIVMALIILLVGVLYFFYQRISLNEEVDVVPKEVSPVKLYVDNCIKSTTEDGLELIGITGGYADVPAKISNDPRAYFSEFANGFKIPYWWHDGIDAVPSE